MNTRKQLYLLAITGAFCGTCFVAVGAPSNALAQLKSSAALETLAEANNQTYLQMKKLGPRATPAQQRALRDQLFAPGLEMLQQERLQQEAAWDNAREAQHSQMLQSLNAGLGGKPSDLSEDRSDDDADEPDEAVPAKSTGETNGIVKSKDNEDLSGARAKGPARSGQGGRSSTGIEYKPEGAKGLEFGAPAKAPAQAPARSK